MIKRGDRVKLTDPAAIGLNNSLHPGRFDWRDRRGVVQHISKNKQDAFVLWDGRRSLDPVPMASLEPEPAESIN
jgi:hypothetical protein